MVNLNGFDASKYEPLAEYEVLPEGNYRAIITASEMKSTKNGQGMFLELTFQVIEGDFTGRNLWARLNLQNQNDTAVKIAQSELSAICRAVGVLVPKDSSELHNRPLIIKVRTKKRNDSGDLTNEIKGYLPTLTSIGEQNASTTSKPPWAR